jgi:hypothetical protein
VAGDQYRDQTTIEAARSAGHFAFAFDFGTFNTSGKGEAK